MQNELIESLLHRNGIKTVKQSGRTLVFPEDASLPISPMPPDLKSARAYIAKINGMVFE